MLRPEEERGDEWTDVPVHNHGGGHISRGGLCGNASWSWVESLDGRTFNTHTTHLRITRCHAPTPQEYVARHPTAHHDVLHVHLCLLALAQRQHDLLPHLLRHRILERIRQRQPRPPAHPLDPIRLPHELRDRPRTVFERHGQRARQARGDLGRGDLVPHVGLYGRVFVHPRVAAERTERVEGAAVADVRAEAEGLCDGVVGRADADVGRAGEDAEVVGGEDDGEQGVGARRDEGEVGKARW